MKSSVRIKYTLIMAGVLFAILLGLILFMNFGLESYVGRSKEKAIKKTVSDIKMRLDTGWSTDDSTELMRTAAMNNFGICIYDLNGFFPKQIYSTNFNLESVRDRLNVYINGGNFQVDEIVEETSSYVLYHIFDLHMANQQIECMGRYRGYTFVITTSMEGIKDSVKVVTEFFLVAFLIAIAVSAIIIFFVCREITKPVIEIARQSQQISKLDFSGRYTGKREDEIGLLGSNMNLMSDKLEETVGKLRDANTRLEADIAEKDKINRMQKEFLGNVSHELKTPIALIQGYAEGLKEGIADDPESVAYYTDVIVDEADKMNTIVKRLLNLDEIESGYIRPVMEDFNISEVIKGVAFTFEYLLKEKNALIQVDVPEILNVYADEFMIEQAVQNYLSNACHHVSENGTVKVCARRDTDGKVTVSVFNTGNPVPEEDMKRIWEKFYKVDKAHTRSYGGSGIGLSIVKSVIDIHGGSVSAENKPDGVEFRFTL